MEITMNGLNEEDSVGSCLELLGEKLLEIFDDFKTHREITKEDVLSEAYLLCDRIENEQLSDSDFHFLFADTKLRLGTYHAASVAMMMAYAIFSTSRDVKVKNRLLMDTISKRYKNRPWMEKVESFVQECREKNHKPVFTFSPQQLTGKMDPVILQVSQAEINILSPGNIIGNTIEYGK